MEIREIVAALRTAWWLPALGMVLGGVAATVISLLQTPLYTAHTQLFVATSDSATLSDAFQGNQFSRDRVASYAQLLGGQEIAARVVDSLDLDASPGAIAREISATAVVDTVLLDVTVTDPDPQRARDIAVAVGVELGEMVNELETPEGSTASPVRVTVVEAPQVPAIASSPRTTVNVALGMVLGLVAGSAAAVARVRSDRSVRDADEAADLVGAPVIGVVLRDGELSQNHLFARADSGGGAGSVAESFRQLRTNLNYLDVDNPPKIIVVSSAVPSEGKTTLTINLALALAEAGQRVTVVEADLRRPRVTRYLGMVGGTGLINVLAGEAEIPEVLQSYGDGRLEVLAAGPTPPNPSELLASGQMLMLLAALREKNDVVLLDAPPLLPFADASGLAAISDGALLAVRYGVTSREELRQAGIALDRVGARTLGVVLNVVPPKAEIAAASGLAYRADYGADERHAVPVRPAGRRRSPRGRHGGS